MDKRRICDDALYTHFITYSVHCKRRLLDHEHPQRILLGVLNAQLESFEAKCVGFVVMRDHVHALIWFPETGKLSRFMHGWKRMSSFHIRKRYCETATNDYKDFDEGDKFWNPKYDSFEIYEPSKLVEKLNYMHLNPVRAGIVQKPEDYRWSSARWYAEQRTVGVPIHWVT